MGDTSEYLDAFIDVRNIAERDTGLFEGTA
jgi:hypothetical protein